MLFMKLERGLGNQFFMYATARSIAKKHNARLAFDISYYAGRQFWRSGPQQEEFWLQHFNIKYDRLIKHDHSRYITSFVEYYDETALPRRPLPSDCRHVFLRGFWQDENNFLSLRSELLEELTLREPLDSHLLHSILSHDDSVALSVRRGDFLTCPDRPVMTVDYYLRAATYVLDARPKAHFFLFSDDDAWVVENIASNSLLASRSTQILRSVCYKDVMLMKACKHHILPNSTFSWWGAWLCTNPLKIVVGPASWNNFGKTITASGWVVLDN